MKEDAIKKKPKYLSLDINTKKEAIASIVSNNADDNYKQMAQECMLFTEEVEKQLKRPNVTLTKIKRLFELELERIKKAHLT